MTDKVRNTTVNVVFKQGDFCEIPERPVGHFNIAQDPGIIVDMEIQPGDPVDSQIIRNFMGEFRAAFEKKSA